MGKQSSRHKHEWKLIDTHGSWKRRREPLPEGQWVPRGGLFGGITYIPGFDWTTILERVVEIINQGDELHYTSETWVCPCGERKVNSRTAPSLHASLGLSQQDTRSTKAKKGVRKNA